jgi:hypothetical protein
MSCYPALNQFNRPPIVVTDNDVLCGRGVNIAAHAGNERFRTLVTTRADANYCEGYSATEKKAVAEEIIHHIASLDPPGRFLKREGRGQVSRGLNGPWEELSRKEALKKTCQALRDCNRNDRETYANGVVAPDDVKAVADEIATGAATEGVSLKDLAARSVVESSERTQERLREAMQEAGVPDDQIEEQLKRQRADPTYVIPGFAMTAQGSFAPISNPGYGHQPSIMEMMGPDGVPVQHQVDLPMPGQMPGLYSQYPHPAMDMPPIDPAAVAAARAAAGYVHPNDLEKQKAAAAEAVTNAEEDHEATEAAVAAAQEAEETEDTEV